MKDISTHFFSMFTGNIKDSKPVGTCSLSNMLYDIKYADPDTISHIGKIREETDEDKKARMKWKLRAWTPGVLVQEHRRYSMIHEFSGLLPLDFDKLPNQQYAEDFRDYLYNEHPYIYASWLSASGKGVRGIVKIPRVDSVEKYKQYWMAVQIKMQEFQGFDRITKNPIQPVFQSYDPNLICRAEAQVWTKIYVPKQPKPKESYPLYKGTDEQKRSIFNRAKSGIDKISDNGHPQLRAIAFVLGGYVGSGYIERYEAVEFIDDCIEVNTYLSKKSSVYKKTAREMIDSGTHKPLSI
jgi:hypothetical protein